MTRDLSGQNVLICGKFWYFGQRAPRLPDDLLGLVKKGPGHKLADDPGVLKRLREFLARFPSGIAARKNFALGMKGSCSSGCRKTD
jgi:putative DNA base modification enzyme with NMAD domain